jgi:hypothetical protein
MYVRCIRYKIKKVMHAFWIFHKILLCFSSTTTFIFVCTGTTLAVLNNIKINNNGQTNCMNILRIVFLLLFAKTNEGSGT